MPKKKQAPKASQQAERYALYFRPREWRGRWILRQVTSIRSSLHDVGRTIEGTYPKGEYAIFVIPPSAAAPGQFTDGKEPGRLRYQTTCDWATFGRQLLQSSVAT